MADYYTGSQAVEHYNHTLETAGKLRASYRTLDGRVAQAITRVENHMADARQALGAAYFPVLSPEAIADLERLTGFKGFSRRDPIAAMAHERHVLERAVETVLADDRYQRREDLIGPEGELTRDLARIKQRLDPFEAEVQRFEGLDTFLELVSTAYDTPEFRVRWWDRDYWRLWAAGDRVCEELGLDDFGDDVLPRYHAALADRDPVMEEYLQAKSIADEIRGLVETHDRSTARLQHLEASYLEESQQALAEFFEHADLTLLSDWLDDDAAAQDGAQDDASRRRAIQMALRRVAGLRAKSGFLNDLAAVSIRPMIASLDDRANKYRRKITKYGRPKYRGRSVTERELDRAFLAKRSKYTHRRNKLSELIERLDQYEDYENFMLSDPPELWWREMTRTRPPTQMRELRAWYDRHPDARPTAADDPWERVDEDAAAVAEAAAAVDHDVDFLS